MLRRDLPLLLTTFLPGCAQPEKIIPDAKNPAHCVAAFNYARYRFMSGGKPDEAGARVSVARLVFEKRSFATEAENAQATAIAIALSKEHGANRDTMLSLLKDCLEKQEKDPKFQHFKASGELRKEAALAKIDR